jgi:hypothetical protein
MLLVGSIAVIVAVAAISTVVARGAASAGTSAQVEKGYMYVAKFTCAVEAGEDENLGLPLIPARYRTAVNIHNPQRDSISFSKKVVLAFAERTEQRGPISQWQQDRLQADEALAVDCVDIEKLLGGLPPIADGFVVIESEVPLDVAAVYTTESVGIDVEYIQPKRIGGDFVE